VAEWENLGALRKAAYGLAKPFEPGAPEAFDGNREAQPFWTMSLLPASAIKPEPIHGFGKTGSPVGKCT